MARLTEDFSRAWKLVDDAQIGAGAAWYEARNLVNQSLRRESAALDSLAEFVGQPKEADVEERKALRSQAAVFNGWIDRYAKGRGAREAVPDSPWAADAEARKIPMRIGEFGPLTYQNDNTLLERLGRDRYSKITLLNSEATPLLSVADQSELYAYEIANFVNGSRSVGEIRDAVSAEYGPLPIGVVADYLRACAEAGIVAWKPESK